MSKIKGNKQAVKTINITANVSGAVEAARQGNVVMIVDIIDMSTAAEVALETGAMDVFGASPDNISVPVRVDPEKVAYFAGKTALKYDTEVVIIAEPRVGNREDREEGIQQVLQGIKRVRAQIADIIPNLGAQVQELTDLRDKIVVLVTKSGGVVFDAAYNYGAAKVITGTVARTPAKKGIKPGKAAARRAIKLAKKFSTGISLVAASSNSYEDILAAEKIGELIIDAGFLQLKE